MNKRAKSWLVRGTAVLSAVAVVTVGMVIFRSDDRVPQDYNHGVTVEALDLRTEASYREVAAGYSLPAYAGGDIPVEVAALFPEAQPLFGSETPAVLIDQDGQQVFSFEVPQDGLYCIQVEYYDDGDSVAQTQAQIQLDDGYPFYEMRSQVFPSRWDYSGQEIQLDRYGNEIVPESVKVKAWSSRYLQDASGMTQEPFRFSLKAGGHTLVIRCEQGSLAIRRLILTAPPAEQEGLPTGQPAGSEIQIVEGEDIAYKNDSTVRPAGEYNTQLTPYSSTKIVMNMLDGNSFCQGGQSVSYTFRVEQSGYFYLGFRYCQSVVVDFPVFRTVSVDGVVPTPDFRAVAFPYTRKYDTLTVSDPSGQPIGVYLEAGEHTLTLTVTLEPIAAILDEIQQISDEVNTLSLQVTKITGNNAGKYRDFDLLTYIPELRDILLSWADRLGEIYDRLHAFNPEVREVGAFSSLLVSRKQLISLAEYPNRLPMRLSELYQGQSSVAQYLADVMESMTNSPASLDSIYVYQRQEDLPKSMGFFEKLWAGIVRFFHSFTAGDYEADGSRKQENTPQETGEAPSLQIWVTRSRLYAELLQKMADESFTAETAGFTVDVSLMPDPQKLVLANAAGSSPDLALGVNSSLPFDLGIRGALKDLTEYPDWEEVTERFFPGLLTVGQIQDHLYALPETTNFFVLFYRTDILDNFGMSVPDTMEEVKSLLPQLRSRGMNFFSHIAGSIGYKPFGATVPLIYQNGGSLYGETALDIAVDSDQTLDAITEMTELFTVYGLDYEVPNFYQHFRNGTLPIGVSDFGTYNLLINSAPEIADSWSIAPVPGYVDENGEVQRWMTGAAESAVIFESTALPDEAWEFLKWWTSADTQLEYANTLQVSYGQEYMWPTANREAFPQLPWKEQDKQVILSQLEWLFEIPRVPGNYMTERELSNAFQEIVLEGESVRNAVDTATRNISAEVERKLQEFGYWDGSNWIEPYTLPADPREDSP